MCTCKCLFIALLIVTCDGQLFDIFGIGRSLLTNPFVQSVNTLTGETLSSVLNVVSQGPIEIARSLGLPGAVPTILNSNNVANSEVIISDYNAGLGNADASLHITQLIPKYGYPVQVRAIATDDDYVLTLHRIPGNGSVIFLMHGMLGSSDDYVIAGPESGLAYLLWDAGYDVWLGNARGNKHSRRHTHLTPSDAAFWDFSWHEIGYYDVPAMIDYVLQETGRSKLQYIGHSQGTTAFFVMASELPQYNEKISIMIALSPVAWMSNAQSPLVRLLAPGGALLHSIAKAIGTHEFFPDTSIVRILKTLLCGLNALSDILCSNAMFLVAGFDFEQLNVTNLPVIYAHTPAGSSVKQFAHYGQGVVSGDFRHFDYGHRGNIQKYGTKVPPSYKVERITAPVSLFYSSADWLAHPADVDELYNRLGNTVDIHKVPFESFNHVDYLWAKDVKTLIFNRVQKLLKLFK